MTYWVAYLLNKHLGSPSNVAKHMLGIFKYFNIKLDENFAHIEFVFKLGKPKAH